MVILDENLIHAGTESLTCGYAPVHSPRYFTYVHHKDKQVEKAFSFNKFSLCGDDCVFCSDHGVKEITSELKKTLSVLNSSGLSMATRNHCTDWIAGDI